ncbi:MAG: hypothetical protein AAFR33_13035, partial [Pseudomonadota bacterium]
MLGKKTGCSSDVARMLAVFVVLFAFTFSAPSSAQSTASPVTIDFIDDRIAVISADPEIDDASRSVAIELLHRAKDALSIRTQRAASLESMEATAQSVDRALADIESRRLELATEPEELGDGIPIEELEARLAVLEAEREAFQDQLSKLRDDSASLSGRGEAIADEVISARTDVAQLLEANELVPEPPEAPVEAARWLLARASLLERQSAIADLQRELETLPARQSLAAARIDLLSAEIARVDETIVLYRLRLSESALDRAEIAIELARADVARFEAAEPELRQLADGNLGLAMEARAAIVRRAALEQLLLDSEREATALSQSNETVRLVLGAGRLSDETAALLKTVRSSLPDQSEISAALFESERQRGDLQLQLIVWLDELRALDAPSIGQQADAASAERQHLVDVRRSTLEALIEGARQESELLSEHELVLSELGQQAGELSSLVDRRLVWLRTSERVNWSWLDRVPQGLAWVLSPSSWVNAIGAIFA